MPRGRPKGSKNKKNVEQLVEEPKETHEIQFQEVDKKQLDVKSFEKLDELIKEVEKEEEEIEAEKQYTLDSLALEIASELGTLNGSTAGLKVQRDDGLIRVMGQNSTYCFSRVKIGANGQYVAEFLHSIPSHIHTTLSGIYKKLNVENNNKTYISPSGIL